MYSAQSQAQNSRYRGSPRAEARAPPTASSDSRRTAHTNRDTTRHAQYHLSTRVNSHTHTHSAASQESTRARLRPSLAPHINRHGKAPGSHSRRTRHRVKTHVITRIITLVECTMGPPVHASSRSSAQWRIAAVAGARPAASRPRADAVARNSSSSSLRVGCVPAQALTICGMEVLSARRVFWLSVRSLKLPILRSLKKFFQRSSSLPPS